MNKKRKKYWEMTTDELVEATKECEREHVADTFRETTPAEKAAWREGRRKRSRRKPGDKKAKVISIGIETSLLQRADALAKKRGISRARLVAESLKALLAEKEE